MTSPDGRKRVVLVVDDVPSMRALAEAVLTNPGTTVIQASDGEAAISSAREVGPDIILLDLAMQGLNGVETLRRLRSIPETRDIPVVIVTALAHSELAQQAITAGANDLIEKPYRPAELRFIVDKWTWAPPAAAV